MRRITRYVLLELITVFFVILVGITSLLIFAGVAAEGVREGLGLTAMAKLVPYVVPLMMRVSIPATILMATSTVFGRMSADNEIVAIKSLGISPMVTIVPALCFAFLVSLVAVWVNDIAVSWGRTGMNRVLVESVEEVAYRILRTQLEYQTRAFSINVKAVEGRDLIKPSIRIRSSSGETTRIDAARARLESDHQANTLKFVLTDMSLVEGDVNVWWQGRYELPISLAEATRKGNNSDSPSLVPLDRITEETRSQHELTRQTESQGATAAAFQMMTGDFQRLAGQSVWQQRQQSIQGARSRLNRLYLEPWRRWANGFSCLFFVMVGAPLAIRRRTANFFTSFAACFLPILLVYYPLLAFGVNQCKDGMVPPYTVWMGNAVLAGVGSWMIRRVVRY